MSQKGTASWLLGLHRMARVGAGAFCLWWAGRVLGPEGLGWIATLGTLLGLGLSLFGYGLSVWLSRETGRVGPSAALWTGVALARRGGLLVAGFLGFWGLLRGWNSDILLLCLLSGFVAWGRLRGEAAEGVALATGRLGPVVRGGVSAYGLQVVVTLLALTLWPTVGGYYGALVAGAVILAWVPHRMGVARTPPVGREVLDPREGARIGWTYFSGGVLLVGDVLLLEWMRGPGEVGLYRVGQVLADYLPIIAAVLNQAALPRWAAVGTGARREIWRRTALWLSLGLFVWPLATVLGRLWAGGVWGEAFLGAAPAAAVMIAAVPLRLSHNTLALGLTSQRADRARFWAITAVASLNLATNVLVIPRWGALGAVATTLCCDVVLWLAFAGALWRHRSGEQAVRAA